MKQRIGKYVGLFWRQTLAYLLVAAFLGVVLFYQIGTLVPGFSLPELAARAQANSFHKILLDPLFLPHKLMQYGLIRAGHSGAFWMRSVSALWGIGVVLLFFDIIRSWYSRRVAVMGAGLFLTSAWFLHLARLGTPTILFTCSVGLLWVGMKLRSATSHRKRTLVASLIILGVCLYVPGLAWIILPMLVWQRKLIMSEFAKIPVWLTAAILIVGLVGITPLIYSFTKHPSLALDWLLIPQTFSPSLWLSNLWHLPVWLILRGPDMPVYWLGHVPLFDIFSIAMAVLGVYVLNYYRLLDRVRAVVAIIILGFILTVFNGWLVLSVALPLFYVLITAGIALFLQQWFTVFPRNPLARTVGLGLVTLIVVLAGYYNLRHYFIAWPRTPETRQVFKA